MTTFANRARRKARRGLAHVIAVPVFFVIVTVWFVRWVFQ
jgi:hypothetical protein